MRQKGGPAELPVFMSGRGFLRLRAAIGVGAVTRDRAVFRVIEVLADHVPAIFHRQMEHRAIPDVGRRVHFHQSALSVGRQMTR